MCDEEEHTNMTTTATTAAAFFCLLIKYSRFATKKRPFLSFFLFAHFSTPFQLISFFLSGLSVSSLVQFSVSPGRQSSLSLSPQRRLRLYIIWVFLESVY